MHSPNSTSPTLSKEPSTTTWSWDAPTQETTPPTPLLSPELEKSLLPEDYIESIRPLEWSGLDTTTTVQLLCELRTKVLKETEKDTRFLSQTMPEWFYALKLLLTGPSWLSTEQQQQSWSLILLAIREIYTDVKRHNEETATKDATRESILQSMTTVEIPAPPPIKMSDVAISSMRQAQLTYCQKKKVWTGPKSHDTDHMAKYWASKQGTFL